MMIMSSRSSSSSSSSTRSEVQEKTIVCEIFVRHLQSTSPSTPPLSAAAKAGTTPAPRVACHLQNKPGAHNEIDDEHHEARGVGCAGRQRHERAACFESAAVFQLVSLLQAAMQVQSADGRARSRERRLLLGAGAVGGGCCWGGRAHPRSSCG